MPELPEVETIRRDLNTYLSGQRIKDVTVFSSKSALPSASFLIKNLQGRRLERVERRGKLLIFHLQPFKSAGKLKSVESHKSVPDYLLIHLKMTGQLIYLDRSTKIAGGHSLKSSRGAGLVASVGGELPTKHTRAIITFQKGGRLFFNDLRKFGYLKLVSGQELKKILQNNYGPEPLTPAFTAAALGTILRRKQTKIKAVLLDQKSIAGLGNIYVDESLWRAKINPERRAGLVSPAEIKKLHAVINQIIKQAIKYRGTTFSDYVDSRGRTGSFSRFLKVYGRGGKSCHNCGQPILKKKVAGRGTHYCRHCQK